MMKCLKKAEMGMGTLIIFIAMILVAAVAAGVLIATTNSLQNKALATGKSTTAEVGTSLNIVQVYGEDGTNQSLEEYNIVIKLNAGSDPIRFQDLLLTLNLNDGASEYNYDDTLDCNNQSQTVAGIDYGVRYSINGTANKAGYLVKGDVALMCFQSHRDVGESERVILTLIPKVGTPAVIDTTLLSLMVDNRIQLFP